MRDKGFLIVILVAAGLAVVASNLLARLSNAAKIHELEMEAAELEHQRDSVTLVADMLDSAATVLQEDRRELEHERRVLRGEVDSLELTRQEDQLTVRRLRRVEDLQERFAETFPQVASSKWGLAEIYDEDEDIEIEYLLIPSFFSETFIIDHQNAQSWLAQRNRLLLVDSLSIEVEALQDSVTKLAIARGDLYQQAYDTAYFRYQALNAEFIEELRKPKFSLGTTGAIVGGVLVGVAVGAIAASN